MPYTPKGPDENVDQGPDSFGHNESESPKRPILKQSGPMPVDVLPIPARDMPQAGVEKIADDDAILDSDRIPEKH